MIRSGKKTIYWIGLVFFVLLLCADIALGAFARTADRYSMGGMTTMSGMTVMDQGQPRPEGEFAMPEGEFTMPEGEFTMPEGGFDSPGGPSTRSGIRAASWLFWPVLLLSLAGIAFCAVGLVRLRRSETGDETVEESAVEDDSGEEPPRRKKPSVLWLVLLAVILVLFLLPGGRGQGSAEPTPEEVLIRTQTTIGDIETVFSGSGTITDAEAEKLTIPDTVELLGYTVRNGDSVKEGDVLARVERSSVLEAAAALQEAINELDKDIQSASHESLSPYVTAGADGRVMAVFAAAGDAVLDVMYENEALVLLSLDGLLAVDIQCEQAPGVGEHVSVLLSNGREESGTVFQAKNGVITVTVADDSAAWGESVEVKDKSGRTLGSGELTIHSELRVTGFSGTVSAVYAAVGRRVYSGQTLLVLKDTAYDGEYESLLRQRGEYAQWMEKLLSMYREGYIYAPCDGIVTGVSEDVAYLPLSSESRGGTVRLLTGVSWQQEARVTLLAFDPGGQPTDPGTPPTDPDGGGAQPVTTYRYAEVLTLTEQEIVTNEGSFPLAGVTVEAGVQVGTIVKLIFEDGVLKTVERALDKTQMPGIMTGGMGMGGFYAAATQAEEEEYTLTEVDVCSVIPNETVSITVSVDELDVLSLAVGQEAQVMLDAVSGQSFTGKVTALSPVGSNEGGGTKYSMTVELERSEQMLGGMNASIRIVVATQEDLVLLPAAAIFQEGKRSYVYTGYDKNRDELTDPVEVITGLSDGENVQILQGLEAGVECYYRYAEKLSYTFD